MKLNPVQQYAAKYPDKYEVDLNRLLLAHRPTRFKTSTAATLLLCALAIAPLSGCNGSVATQMQTQKVGRKMNMAPIFDGVPVVSGMAPIFDGAPVVSGTMFKGQTAAIVPLGNYPGPGDLEPLTEEAALMIIREELTSQGLESAISQKHVSDTSNQLDTLSWTFDLTIDGAKEPVYAEFIPLVDAESESEREERENLNLSETPREAAVSLRETLSHVSDESTGVIFYHAMDEMAFHGQNLRAQVSEFVVWMKTTGLI